MARITLSTPASLSGGQPSASWSYRPRTLGDAGSRRLALSDLSSFSPLYVFFSSEDFSHSASSRPDEVLDDLCSLHDECERKFIELPSLRSLIKYSMPLLKTCSRAVLESETKLADLQNQNCCVECISSEYCVWWSCDECCLFSRTVQWLFYDSRSSRRHLQEHKLKVEPFWGYKCGRAVCKLQHCWKRMADSSAGLINMSARATTPKSRPAVGTADPRAVLKSKSHYSLACQLVAPYALTKTNQTLVLFPPTWCFSISFSLQSKMCSPLFPSLNTTGTCFQ